PMSPRPWARFNALLFGVSTRVSCLARTHQNPVALCEALAHVLPVVALAQPEGPPARAGSGFPAGLAAGAGFADPPPAGGMPGAVPA
ncbi:hypothetical protein RZS08_63970, partial [Arthrospira platensis SPKY1]|nr:hypothetical protein [Arthrospira platensis SPKY1]